MSNSIQPLIAAVPPQPLAARGAVKDTPGRIQQAASEFEALLIAQMLKNSRAASGGLSSDDDDGEEANSTMIELGEQQFAQALAASGGLGIAKMVVAGLTKNADR